MWYIYYWAEMRAIKKLLFFQIHIYLLLTGLLAGLVYQTGQADMLS